MAAWSFTLILIPRPEREDRLLLAGVALIALMVIVGWTGYIVSRL